VQEKMNATLLLSCSGLLYGNKQRILEMLCLKRVGIKGEVLDVKDLLMPDFCLLNLRVKVSCRVYEEFLKIRWTISGDC
jgi:hypothetical protein